MTTVAARAETRPPRRSGLREAAVHSLAIAAASLVSFWLTVHLIARIHSLSTADDQLGGMWAVIATVFVYRTSYRQDRAAAQSRAIATALSFVLCLAYLLILPVHPLGLAVLIGIGTMVLTISGHPDEVITTGITTAVVLVVAGLSPHDAWQQPILRVADTAVGIAVGLGAAAIAASVAAYRSR